MISNYYLNLVKKHTPVFSCLESVPSPFLHSYTAAFPNKFKYVMNPVEEFTDINPGIYFVLPNEAELTSEELAKMEDNLKSGLNKYGCNLHNSLSSCTAFAAKFKGLKKHPALNVLECRGGKLHYNKLVCVVDNRPMFLKDYMIAIPHLLNFYIVSKNVEYKNPFFRKVLDSNLNVLHNNLSPVVSGIRMKYTTNRFTGAMALTIKIKQRVFYADSGDLDSMLDFLMPLLYNMYTEDTDLTSFLEYRKLG